MSREPAVGLEAGRLEARFDHAEAAERKNGALERLIGLQADDHLVIAINISGLVREQRRRCFGINVEHAFLAFFLEKGPEFLPDRQCAPGR